MATLHLTLPDLDATRAVGAALAETLPPQAVVLCSGDLGAGKTTLVKAVCAGLGIPPAQVGSPTYTLVNVYPGPRAVYHVDLYRLDAPEALLELDADDWVNPAGLTFIEWPDPARPLLAGAAVLELTLAPLADTREGRALTVDGAEEPFAAVFAALRRWQHTPATPARP